jgi:hypothetical protein|tara:strand:+ start:1254 stop:1454 length:201 start_codon:yes stop_codon:yes gene_type:complete
MIKLRYKKRMKKKGNKIVWQILERPTNSLVGEYFFEEDAKQIVDFQNKNQVWAVNGGVPSFMVIKT